MASAVGPATSGPGIGSAVGAFVGRHPLATYVVLALALTWGVVVALVGPDGLPATPDGRTLVGLGMLAGPGAAGLLVTGLVSGRSGLRALLARLLVWRVGWRWYAFALATAPLLTVGVALALSLRSPEFRPAIAATGDPLAVVLTGLAAGLLVGACEELGWTGFAVPWLRRRRGAVATGLVVGVVWGAWHFVLFWERDSFSGALPLALLLARLFAWLPAYRLLLVWVHDRTGSLPLVMLMHASLAATQLVVEPPAPAGALLTSILAWSAALWVLVLVVALVGARGSRRGRRAVAGI
jgi:membrane protease YdiL (CAAX protease family)